MGDIEDQDRPTQSWAGDRLREAREAKGLSLEDIATQTRIPVRHLEAIETGDFERLPAPTYTLGFAKSYASAVDVDRGEIADAIREELGGTRPATSSNESFEPVDPARTMPRWLVLSALVAAVVVVIALTLLNRQSLDGPATEIAAVAEDDGAETSPPPAAAAAPAAPSASGPVVIAAREQVWLQVYERGGATLFQGELAPGQRYQVPASAAAPLLRTGKPEAIVVTANGREAPPVGPPARTVSDVSLRPADLFSGAQSVPPPGPAAG